MPDAVAQYTVANAIVAVRTATAHDSDTQTTDAQITDQLDQDYRDLRRFISQFAPTMYQDVETFTIAAGALTITQRSHDKPVNYERIIRMEYDLGGGCWEPLATRSVLHASQGVAVDVAGDYRMTYVTQPIDGYTAFDIPPGASRILVQLAAAFVRQRHDEDPSYHEQKAAQLKADLRRDLVMRQGAHPVCALVTPDIYGSRSFYEEGDHFVIC